MLFTTSYDCCFKQPSYLTFVDTAAQGSTTTIYAPPSSDVMCACSLEGNKLRARNETEMRQTETTYRPRDWVLIIFCRQATNRIVMSSATSRAVQDRVVMITKSYTHVMLYSCFTTLGREKDTLILIQDVDLDLLLSLL